ncbi:MAG: GNAT family N-acetyltransferase [Firmicutes bacterium]|nr:GNAT family N-acetyltransferase [Bacillota bacterium]
MEKLIIRKLNSDEYHLLEDFLYEAVFQDPAKPLPRSVVNEPEMSAYIQDFGRPHDNCLVAVLRGSIVGAVWTRIISGEVQGYGYVDDKTPEFAISVNKNYRGLGIGTQLMYSMIGLLKENGYHRVSLSVQKANRAVKLYRTLGFEVFKEQGEELLMVLKL